MPLGQNEVGALHPAISKQTPARRLTVLFSQRVVIEVFVYLPFGSTAGNKNKFPVVFISLPNAGI